MAAPEREVFALVGDGSYLMMAQEIVTAVSEGIKLILVIVQNHGFASIGSLSESLGSQRFGTYYRYRDAESGPARRRQAARSTWPRTPRASAPRCIRVQRIDEFREAVGAGQVDPHHRRDPHRDRPAGPGARRQRELVGRPRLPGVRRSTAPRPPARPTRATRPASVPT